jgi:hypothetical protein
LSLVSLWLLYTLMRLMGILVAIASATNNDYVFKSNFSFFPIYECWGKD